MRRPVNAACRGILRFSRIRVAAPYATLIAVKGRASGRALRGDRAGAQYARDPGAGTRCPTCCAPARRAREAGSARARALSPDSRRARLRGLPGHRLPADRPRCPTSTALTALSPLDGRYAAKVAPLAAHFSEFGLIRARVRVEIAWLVALSEEPRIAEVASVRGRDACPARSGVDVVRAGGRRARQGDRAHDQSRRQGGRVLAEGALRRRSGDRPRRRIHPLRLHVRGHQQPRPRADARRGAAGDPAAGAARHRVGAALARARARRRADARRARTASRRRRRRSARRSPTSTRGSSARSRRSSACRSRAR